MDDIKYICDSCEKELSEGEYPIVIEVSSYRDTDVKKERLKVRQIEVCEHCHDEIMSIFDEAKQRGVTRNEN